MTILLTGLLLLGLLRREKHGIANIGFESFLVLVLYFGSFAFLLAAGLRSIPGASNFSEFIF